MNFAGMAQEGEKELDGPGIGPQSIGPAIAAVQVQHKGLGLLLARKPRSLQLLQHLSQTLQTYLLPVLLEQSLPL